MSTSAVGPARYHRFLRELLGAVAYGELSAFERLSSDARYSPTLRDRAVLGRLAVLEFQRFELVCARLAELGEDARTPWCRSSRRWTTATSGPRRRLVRVAD